MLCSYCKSDLLYNHVLENNDISPMTNKSRIIHAKCSVCGYFISLHDVRESIKDDKKVLLITGTAGAGKTALGQLIESNNNYIFIDGDAIQKKENFYVKRDPSHIVDYQTETLHTMLILLALGYNVVVGYIINRETLSRYIDELNKHKITPVFRVLIPERVVCLKRDIDRECWTAGEKWVDMWYEEMRSYLTTHNSLCIDSTNETLEETYEKHFKKIL